MGLLEEIIRKPIKIAGCIEHTNVNPGSTSKDIKKLCKEALKHRFYSAVVLPYYAKFAKEIVGEKAKVVTVVGFPYGVQPTKAKVEELKETFEFVDEFDMVMNRNALKNRDYGYVVEDIKRVVDAAKPKIIKVIIESPTLTKKEIKKASQLVMEAKANFVKTAVGYAGATKVEDVKIIKSVVKDKLGIKASGGIKNFEQALKMIRAGATRIGTSHGVEIIKSIK